VAEGIKTRAVDGLSREVRSLEPGSIRPELYHLPEDPTCERNVLDAHGDVAKDLHGRFVRFLEGEQVSEENLRYFRTL
jgi:hypothetical protein